MQHFCKSKLSKAALALVLLGVSSIGLSANIPCDTARLIVPWGAGGGTDVIFRQFVDSANKAGAKPQLQVVNIPGQGGNKGAKDARGAKPDGCTLFAIHQSAITSYFTGRVDFTWNAFEPVARLTHTASYIGANAGVPYSDLKGLIAAAKKAPNSIVAGGTFGSVSQFVFLLIEDAAGVKFKHVSYDGTAERMTALLANNIQIGEVNLTSAVKYLESGELKALGLMSADRLAETPNVATSKEQGINVVFGVERGVMLPKGASAEVINHYSDIFKKASENQALKTSLKAKGTAVQYMSASNYSDHLSDQYTKWEAIAKDVGVYKRTD